MAEQHWKSKLRMKWEAEIQNIPESYLKEDQRQQTVEYIRRYTTNQLTSAQLKPDCGLRTVCHLQEPQYRNNTASGVANIQCRLVANQINSRRSVKFANMSPETREKIQQQMKVNNAKEKLRKQLEEKQELSAQEIDIKLRKLHEDMWRDFDPTWTWECFGKGKGNGTTSGKNYVRQNQPEDYKTTMFELETNFNWLQTLTPEARQLHDEKVRRAQFSWWAKRAGEDPDKTDKTLYELVKTHWDREKVENPEKFKQCKQSQKNYYANMTREQRERRLYMLKVSRVKRRLRKKYWRDGKLDALEIEARLMKVEKEMWLAFDPKWASETASKRKARSKVNVNGATCYVIF